MKSPPGTTAGGQPGFVVNGETLDHPAGTVGIGKQHWRAPEYMLEGSPHSIGPVQVKDVGELVGEDQAQPFVIPAQPDIARGRSEVDRDAIGGKNVGEAVGEVHVVVQHKVHDAAGFSQLSRKRGVRSLRLAGRGRHDVGKLPVGVDTEMFGGPGVPVAAGIVLGGEGIRE